MKILLISHNPISDYTNMGKTFTSLFSEFSRDELYQLYICGSLPNIDMCESYFRMTDREALKSVLNFKKFGQTVKPVDKIENANFNRPKLKFEGLAMWARDVVWTLAKWKNRNLNKWIEEIKPDFLFVAPGDASIMYKMAIYIFKQHNIPIISYICDNFYKIYKTKKSLIQKLHYHRIDKHIKKLMKKSTCVVTICDELSKYYQEEFGVNTKTICTGANIPINKDVQIIDNGTLNYFGNFSIGRYKSLVKIGSALDEINKKNNSEYVLNVYGVITDETVKESFDKVKTIKYCGFVNANQMHEIMKDTRLLFFVEDFAKDSIMRVKYSVSTKIADSLASGIPLFAYGPKCIASINHLINNSAAIICTNDNQLEELLEQALKDDKLLETKSRNGLSAANQFHDQKQSSLALKEVFTTYRGRKDNENNAN